MSALHKPITWPEIDYSGESAMSGQPNLYADLQRMRQETWTQRALAYEQTPGDFYTAWWWLQGHPIFWYFTWGGRHEKYLCWERGVDEGLEFRPVKVNPKTGEIDDDPARNTRLEVWVEVFPASLRSAGPDLRRHDTRCDTGGTTYEKAVVTVAREVYRHYGNDRTEMIWIDK